MRPERFASAGLELFNAADIYIIVDGGAVAPAAFTASSIFAKGRGLAAKQALFSSEEYVNIYYSYSEGMPAIEFRWHEK